MSIHTIISMTIAFISTLFCIQLLKPLSIKLGLVDIPTDRKQHQGLIPIIGGLALTYGFLIGALTMDYSLAEYRSLIASISLLLIVGVVDDFHELTPQLRLMSQILVAFFIIAWGGLKLVVLGNIFDFGNIILNAWTIPITAAAIIGIINATNIIDGQDGLAGSVCFTQAAVLAFLAWRVGRLEDAHLLLMLCASIFAFLLLNYPIPGRKHALIFMGDAGSTVLGLILCWFCITLSQGTTPAAHPVTFLWIMGFPIMDTISAIARRILRGESPLAPDRGHLHHHLQKIGLSKHVVTPIALLLHISFIAIGVAGDYFNIAPYFMLLGFVVVLMGYFCFIYSHKPAIEKAV